MCPPGGAHTKLVAAQSLKVFTGHRDGLPQQVECLRVWLGTFHSWFIPFSLSKDEEKPTRGNRVENAVEGYGPPHHHLLI